MRAKGSASSSSGRRVQIVTRVFSQRLRSPGGRVRQGVPDEEPSTGTSQVRPRALARVSRKGCSGQTPAQGAYPTNCRGGLVGDRLRPSVAVRRGRRRAADSAAGDGSRFGPVYLDTGLTGMTRGTCDRYSARPTRICRFVQTSPHRIGDLGCISTTGAAAPGRTRPSTCKIDLPVRSGFCSEPDSANSFSTPRRPRPARRPGGGRPPPHPLRVQPGSLLARGELDVGPRPEAQWSSGRSNPALPASPARPARRSP